MLLFGSGLCALIYQVAWLRELRLVFGASTPASAAVLAVFMGGLGVGSLLLGKRADRTPRPLALYAKLELGIALAAALTPLFLWVARAAYIAVGGTTHVGAGFGTVIRLLLAAVVLLPPTLLMGGTLPAAARAATSEDDAGRRSTALLYGANTLGAVLGAALSTFLLLEIFGTRLTLWLGCALNALVAMLARVVDRGLPALPVISRAAEREVSHDVTSSPMTRFVLVSAGLVGLVFLQLELVWYRMLSPLLGGSTYTFGLILAVALFGIGVGGLLYNARGRDRRPTLVGFASTCALEALFVAIPLALGDRVALLALFLRPMGAAGLTGHALAWTAVTALVVLPPALVAGYQFPLLIGLLGEGRGAIGRHVGLAYATNTVGSIIGSLASGFVLLPALGAVRTWSLGAWTLVAIGAAALELSRGKRWLARGGLAPAALVVVVAGLLLTSAGPTAVWRHSPIGTGRVDHVTQYRTRNELEAWMRQQRLSVSWEAEGRESSVALAGLADNAFLVNGKADGSAVSDATTQVMSGLLGAIVQPQVKRALVIGLGTGSTAGWLAKMPEIEAVDVVEIEPAIVDVARELSMVNEAVLDNPKVHVQIADAREVLLTTPHQYDLIFSEPSNPYRAGIASLFTEEFYAAAKQRLRPGGAFLQWMQGYEIDGHSVRTVYVTLATAFSAVQSWRTDVDDLLLMARAEDAPVDMGLLRRRVTEEPFDRALTQVWGNASAEAVLGHWVAGSKLPQALAAAFPELVNTDDQNLLEFGLARSLGRPNLFSINELRAVARGAGFGDPPVVGDVDWDAVEDARMAIGMIQNGTPPRTDVVGEGAQRRYRALGAWGRGNAEGAVREWSAQDHEPRSRLHLLVLADAHAALGNAELARPLISELAKVQPVEAAMVEARLAFVLGDAAAASHAFTRALSGYRTDPWPCMQLMSRGLELIPTLVQHQPELRERFVSLLSEPFAAHVQRGLRLGVRFELSLGLEDPARCVESLAPMEPHVVWTRAFLEKRAACYRRARHTLADRAGIELEQFNRDAGMSVAESLGIEVIDAPLRP